MAQTEKQKLYFEMHNWIDNYNFKIFGTLTLRNEATNESMRKATKHFFNCVNRKVFGNAHTRRKRHKLKTATTLQQMAIGNWHTHFVLELADYYEEEKFINLLKNIWQTKVKGAGKCEIEAIKHKKKAIGYILHDINKLGTDTLALESTRL